MPVKAFVLHALVAMCLIAGMSAAARAETLNQALVDAWHNNSRIAAARANQSAARHSLRAAEGGWYPRLGLNGKLARDHTEGTITLFQPAMDFSADLNQATIALRLEQPLWEGGRLASRISAAKRSALASRAHVHARTAQVFLNAVKVYLDVVAAQKLLQVQKDNVAVIQRQKEAARAALDHGEGTRTEVAQADSRLQRAVARRIRAAAALARARALYRAVIGHEPDTLSLPATLPELPPTLTQAKRLASHNYGVKTARLQARSAAARAELADSAVMPSIRLFAEARRAREPQYGFQEVNDTMIGISLSVPIWRGGSLRARSAAAHDKAHAVGLEARAIQDHARSRVVASWHEYMATQAAMQAIEAQRTAARIAYDGVQAEYRHGERTLLDVLNAEQEVRSAEAALIQARRDRIVAAYALLAATGKLTAETLGFAPVKKPGAS
ncbi:MAG: TolC family outer membrane protein [Gammaproteobacteria bacterium]|nr:TolC family outer membrane protein [Gammaproteobacteria bacterium]